jgi:hypothetical protein
MPAERSQVLKQVLKGAAGQASIQGA